MRIPLWNGFLNTCVVTGSSGSRHVCFFSVEKSPDPNRKLTYPHLGKRKIIFKMPFLGDMLIPRRVIIRMILVTVSWLAKHSSDSIVAIQRLLREEIWLSSTKLVRRISAISNSSKYTNHLAVISTFWTQQFGVKSNQQKSKRR